MKGFVQDPQARLDYTFNWGPWLNGDTITNSTWVAESPLIIAPGSESFDATTTTVYLTGGDLEGNYIVINSITTLGGRLDDRSIQINVRNK